MKPKYEIGQTVFYVPTEKYVVITAIRKNPEGYLETFSYQKDEANAWYNEKAFTLDNKKYYILYRSADGLEKREESQKEFPARLIVIDRTVMRASPCPRCNSPARSYRSYRYTETVLSHDGTNTTETYIYDEGI